MSTAERPGQVVGIDGIVIQCDADDPISGFFIRPIQELSLAFRSRPLRAPVRGVPMANHAGIRVRIAMPDGKIERFVVEQLNGTLVQYAYNALSWTPWREFKLREGPGGWDVTVPATEFDCVEPADVLNAIRALNRETGQPFYREFCTSFIERIFGNKHLFDDVEVLDWLVPGPGPRIPEPAAPCFKRDAKLSLRARFLLRLHEHGVEHAPQRILIWLALQIGRLAYAITKSTSRRNWLEYSSE